MHGVLRDFVFEMVEQILRAFFALIAIPFVPIFFVLDRLRSPCISRFSHALITGASSGLGEDLAIRLAKTHGSQLRLTLTGRNKQRLDDVVQRCRSHGADAVGVIVDVADTAAIAKAVIAADDAKPLDLVIANAGTSESMLGLKTLEKLTEPLFATNVNGALATVYPIAARMATRKRGQIAIVSSIAGFLVLPDAIGYSSTKIAVRSWAEGLRHILKPHNVGVTAICPGYVRSAMTDINREEGRNMPFFMENEAATDFMMDGITRNVAVVTFPASLALPAKLGATALPLVLRSAVMGTSMNPRKSRDLVYGTK